MKPWDIPLTPGHRLGCLCHLCFGEAKRRRAGGEPPPVSDAPSSIIEGLWPERSANVVDDRPDADGDDGEQQ